MRVAFIVIAVSTLAGTAVAQPVPAQPQPGPQSRVGLRFGVTSATLGIDGEEEGLAKRTGFAAGLFTLIPVGPNFLIDAGVGYAQKGTAFDAPGLERAELQLDYIQIPILAVAQIPVSPTTRLRIFGGPNLNIRVDAKVSVDGEEEDFEDGIEAYDYGVVVGAGIDVDTGSNTLVFDVRYEHGLSSIDKADDNDASADVFHRVLSANAGIAF